MTSFYRMKPASFRSIASVLKPFYSTSVMGRLSLAGFLLISLPTVVFADDAVLVPANSAEGWESPAKLKPYVKLPPDGSGVVTPKGTTGTPTISIPANSSIGTTSSGTPSVTVKKETIEITSPADSKEIDSAVKSIILDSGPDVLRLRKDRKAAKRLANYHWLDKAADANPRIIEAITMHNSAAKILAKHPRLAEIAEADHYTCRRITKYKTAARVLARNGDIKEVAALDPEGLYVAIKRDRKIIKILSRNPIFDQMIVENPDLARVISKYM